MMKEMRDKQDVASSAWGSLTVSNDEDSKDITSTVNGTERQSEALLDNNTHVCPKCGRPYIGYPALSRLDNKTEICPDCGIKEALDDYLGCLEEMRLG